jgi:hypothetical protein
MKDWRDRLSIYPAWNEGTHVVEGTITTQDMADGKVTAPAEGPIAKEKSYKPELGGGPYKGGGNQIIIEDPNHTVKDQKDHSLCTGKGGIQPLLLKFIGGDGDQSYIAEGTGEVIERDDVLATIGGDPAIVLRMLDGPRKGEYVAITSYYQASLASQIRDGMVGAVVYPLGSACAFTKLDHVPSPVGMAALKVV